MKNSKNKEKQRPRRWIGVLIVLAVAAFLAGGAVWLLASGWASAAIDTVIRWGEDGTVDRFGAVVVERVVPVVVGIFTALGSLLAVSAPLVKKLRTAGDMMDKGTEQAVSTYGERAAMQAEMQAFMETERRANEEMRRAMRDEFSALSREHRQSLAEDRATVRRIEGKVDGIRRMESEAFGATAELVRKGVAVKINEIRDETEGGGDGDEAGGDDGQAAESEETHQ